MAAGDGQCLAADQGQDSQDAVEAFGGAVLTAVGAEGSRGDVVLGVVDGGGQQGGRGQRPGFFDQPGRYPAEQICGPTRGPGGMKPAGARRCGSPEVALCMAVTWRCATRARSAQEAVSQLIAGAAARLWRPPVDRTRPKGWPWLAGRYTGFSVTEPRAVVAA